MIPRYRLLAERLRSELSNIEQVVARAEGAVLRAEQTPQDRDYFIAAAAFDLHGFYAGMERLFEVLAGELDKNRPAGPQWHRDLLTQMTLPIPRLRPAIISSEAATALIDYLEFRHVVQNVYTFNLKTEMVVELVGGLRRAFDLTRRDLVTFINFLENLSTADEDTK